MYGGFCDNFRTSRPKGSSKGEHALPRRYPLWTCTPNIRYFELRSARRLALEKGVMDGRAIGGWGVRPLVGFPDRYPGTGQKRSRGNDREIISTQRHER
jgi:hypothetical protein